MAIIYQTENLFKKERGILPWRYIGSDQHNNPDYFGSNSELKRDYDIYNSRKGWLAIKCGQGTNIKKEQKNGN